MKMTSAEANKLLKKWNEEYTAILAREERSKCFLAAMGEDVESLRPVYDYCATQDTLRNLETRIRRLKHTINVFNVTHTVDGFSMTIDEMLVFIPQLTKLKNKLAKMKEKLPKERVEESYGRMRNIIDYSYINYPLGMVELDFEKVSATLSGAQIALDLINNSEKMEVDL